MKTIEEYLNLLQNKKTIDPSELLTDIETYADVSLMETLAEELNKHNDYANYLKLLMAAARCYQRITEIAQDNETIEWALINQQKTWLTFLLLDGRLEEVIQFVSKIDRGVAILSALVVPSGRNYGEPVFLGSDLTHVDLMITVHHIKGDYAVLRSIAAELAYGAFPYPLDIKKSNEIYEYLKDTVLHGKPTLSGSEPKFEWYNPNTSVKKNIDILTKARNLDALVIVASWFIWPEDQIRIKGMTHSLDAAIKLWMQVYTMAKEDNNKNILTTTRSVLLDFVYPLLRGGDVQIGKYAQPEPIRITVTRDVEQAHKIAELLDSYYYLQNVARSYAFGENNVSQDIPKALAIYKKLIAEHGTDGDFIEGVRKDLETLAKQLLSDDPKILSYMFKPDIKEQPSEKLKELLKEIDTLKENVLKNKGNGVKY